MPSVFKPSLAVLALAGLCLTAPAGADPLDPLAFGSLGALAVGPGAYTVFTDGAAPTLVDSSLQVLATGWYVAQSDAFNPQVAVFSFDSIVVSTGAAITAVGNNPLALLSRGDISFAGQLDAAGRAGGPQGAGLGGRAGPGGGAGGSGGSGIGQPGVGPGGGQGGFVGLGDCSWGEGGAYGGAGSHWNPCLTPAVAYGDPALVLNGGSGGGASGANLFGAGAGGGGVELGALGTITLLGGSLLNVAGGDFGTGLAVNAGGGSGGALLLHAPSIGLYPDLNGPVQLDASGFSGGRISFLTASGAVLGNTAGVTVAANFYGHEGVISYATLSPVPEPSTIWMLLAGGAVLRLRRRRRASPSPASPAPRALNSPSDGCASPRWSRPGACG
jgi:hypothetical protein